MKLKEVREEHDIIHEGDVSSSGTLFWNNRYLLLAKKDDQVSLHVFDSDKESNSQKSSLDISQDTSVEECDNCKSDSYCFNLYEGEKKKYTFCTKKSADQEAWLKALTENQCKLKEVPLNVSAKSLFEFTSKDIDGQDVPLSKYEGNVILVVNVASEWGLTQKNYQQLAEIYEKYKDQGLEIFAYPCNQFGKQEPGTSEEIKSFAQDTMKATFPLFEKVDVNGENADPVFKFLRARLGGLFGNSIKWNFTKFLVTHEGIPKTRYAPITAPNSIVSDIEKLLAKRNAK